MGRISTLILLFFILTSSCYSQLSFIAPELIGRITNSSATVNMEADSDLIYYFDYGSSPEALNLKLPNSGYYSSPANTSFEHSFINLTANAKYYYRLVYSEDNGDNWIERDVYSFNTQKPVGSDFVFTVSSDSHIETTTGPARVNLYRKALQNIANDNPDLHFDLGDAIGMEDVALGDTSAVRAEYLMQREHMGLISHSTPIYLCVGNHEDEEGWNIDDTSVVALSRPYMNVNHRKKHFLNPIPNDFFSGNSDNSYTDIIEDHFREDYYSFEWGDALFVVIEPFWNTMIKPYPGSQGGEINDELETGDRWDWTLGEEQYLWFKQTLESSNSKWKFVFAHHVSGGTNLYGRGGAEAAHDFEWGASSAEFSSHRADWTYSTSIHQMMVDNATTVFFHGHDHVYAKEEIDGMIYQECPQPSDIDYGTGFNIYNNNDSTLVINNSGHLRVSVKPTEVSVDYVRAFLPSAGENGTVAHSYTILDESLLDGCTNPLYIEYSSEAVADDGSCNTLCIDSLNTLQVQLDEAESAASSLETQITDVLSQTNLEQNCFSILVDLPMGWDMIGYALNYEQDIVMATAEIVDHIIVVKDEQGMVYLPEWDFNGIGNLIPGKGYLIKTSQSILGFSWGDN